MSIPEFKLDAFEGPLDLLLHLITKHKLNIYDIEISLLLDQYLEYIEGLEEQDFDSAGDFLAMAARLVYIKTCSLLPQPEEAEEMKKELQGELLDYSECKAAAKRLLTLSVYGEVFVRPPEKQPVNKVFTGTIDPQKLVEAYLGMNAKTRSLKPVRAEQFTPLVRSRFVTVTSKIIHVLKRLLKSGECTVAELYVGVDDKSSRVATFLAVLELAKSGRIRLNDDNTVISFNRSAPRKHDPNAKPPKAEYVTPCIAIERKREEYTTPCITIERNKEEYTTPCITIERNKEEYITPCISIERNKEEYTTPCITIERNKEEYTTPCIAIECNKEEYTTPNVTVERSAEQFRSTEDRSVTRTAAAADVGHSHSLAVPAFLLLEEKTADSEENITPTATAEKTAHREEYIAPTVAIEKSADREEYIAPTVTVEKTADREEYITPTVTVEKTADREEYITPAITIETTAGPQDETSAESCNDKLNRFGCRFFWGHPEGKNCWTYRRERI